MNRSGSLNRVYSLVWSVRLGAWVVASELTQRRGKSGSVSRSGRWGAAVLLLGGAINALAQSPTGGTVVGGSATIVQNTPALTTITQATQKAIIDWQSFSIGAGNTVQFVQPNASAIALNRVTGNQASQINGSLLANGQVWLLNPNGVLIGAGGQVNVGSFLGTTHSLSNQQFMQGDYRFSGDGVLPGAMVSNLGSITANNGGYAILAGNAVRNEGTIQANLGQVVLGGAKHFTVDVVGDKLLSFAITGEVDAQPLDGKALVDNNGTLQADGGRVTMTAKAVGDVIDKVINTTGVLQAQSAQMVNGEIVLSGGNSALVNVAGTLNVSNPTGKAGNVSISGNNVAVSAGIDASGHEGGRISMTSSLVGLLSGKINASGQTKGGTVHVLGKEVTVTTQANIDATGNSGGGQILVGGGWQGASVEGQKSAVKTTIQSGARLDASAIQSGNGGEIVAWSDVQNTESLTRVEGVLLAQGGKYGGDGGRVETSGYKLNIHSASVSTLAPLGKTGRWLLDPVDFTIAASGGDITASSLVTLLQSNNVTIQTTGTHNGTTNLVGGTGTNGDIFVNEDVAWTSTNTLTLQADRLIQINANISNNTTGALSLIATTDGVSGAGNISLSGGSVTINQGGTSTYSGVISGTGTAFTKLGAGTLILTGANTYSGNTTINAGTLQVGDGTANGSLGNAGVYGGAISVATGSKLTFNSSINHTLNGNITGAGVLTKSGTGKLTLTGTNTYTGGTELIAGTLSLDKPAPAIGQMIGTGALKITGGSTLTAYNATGQFITLNNPIELLSGDTTISVSSVGTDIKLAGVVSGPGSITVTGSGRWVEFNALNSFQGGVTIAGIGSTPSYVSLANSAGLGTGTLTSNGSSNNWVNLRLTNNMTITNPIAIGSGKFLNITGGVISEFSGVISGAGSLVLNGTSSTLLSGANTYQGSTLIKTGTVKLGNVDALSNFVAPITISSGATLDLNGQTLTAAKALSIAGTGAGGAGALTNTSATAATYSGLVSLTGNASIISNAGAITLSNTGTIAGSGFSLTLDGTASGSAISSIVGTGTGGLTKAGSGSWLVTGNNTYTGNTSINAGTLQIGNGGTTGSIDPTTSIVNNGTLVFNRSNEITHSGAISGSGSITKLGNATLNLTGNNTYSGGTLVQAGNLQGQLGSQTTPNFGTGDITISSSAALWISYATLNNNIILNGGAIYGTNGFGEVFNGTITINNPSTINIYDFGTFNGNISGSGGLTLSTFMSGGSNKLFKFVGDNTNFTGGITVSGVTLQVGNGSTTGNLNGNNSITNNGALVFNKTSNISFAGNISGSGSVIQQGTGILTLSGTNSYTGATNLNAGTLSLGSADALGGTTSAAINTGGGTISFNGGILQHSATNAIDYSSRFSSAANQQYKIDTNGQNITLASALTSTNGTFTKIFGAGRVHLTADNTYTGLTSVIGGELWIGQGSTPNNSGSIAGDLFIDAGGYVGFELNKNITYSGVISGSGLIDKWSGYTLALSGNNSGFTGSIALTQGTISLGSANALGGVSRLDFNGGMLQYTAANTTDYSGIFYDNKLVNVDTNGQNITWAANRTFYNLTKEGAGTLTLTGTNNVSTGPVTISSGTLQIGNGGTAGSLDGTNSITNNGTLVFNRSVNITFAGNISGTGSVTKQGAGTLTLSGNNSYSGTTSLNDGVLALNSASALGGTNTGNVNTGGGSISFEGGTLQHETNNWYDYSARFSNAPGQQYKVNTLTHQIKWMSALTSPGGSLTVTTTSNGFLSLNAVNTYDGGTTITTGSALALGYGGSGSIVGNVVNHGNLGLRSSGNMEFTGDISGSGSVHKWTASGTMTLSGNNTYTGGTAVFEGTLALGSANAMGSTGVITLHGGQLKYSSDTNIVFSDYSPRFSNTKSINIDTNGRDITYAADISVSGTSTIIKSGLGKLTLAGNNTLSGSTTINGGTLQIGNGGTTGDISGTSNIVINNNSALIFNRSDNIALSKGISGTGSITQQGTGILTLTGGNSYTGATIINAGTLQIGDGGTTGLLGKNGSNYSAVTIAQGATLSFYYGGTSTVIGIAAHTISGGGTLKFKGTGVVDESRYYIGAINATGLGGTAQIEIGAGAGVNLTQASNLGSANINVLSGGSLLLSNVSINNNISIAGLGVTTNMPAPVGQVQAGAIGLMGSTLNGNITLTADARITAYDSGTSPNYSQVNGVIDGNFALEKSGPVDLILSGNNTYSGGTTISQGTLQIISGGSSGAISIASGSTLAINSNNDQTLSGNITGAGVLSKSGTGILNLTGTNTYTGGTTVLGGTLSLNQESPVTNEQIGTGILTMAGGTTLQAYNSLGQYITLNNNINLTSGLTNINVDFGGSVDISLAGVISGSGGIKVDGTGRWLNLNNLNDFSGGVTVGGGSAPSFVYVSNASALGSGTVTSINTNSQSRNIQINGDFQIANSIFVDSGYHIYISGYSNTNQITFSGAIQGAGNVVFNNPGTTTITGVNSYQGTTSILSGTVKLGNVDALSNFVAPVAISSGATLDLNGFSPSNSKPLSLAGTGVNNQGALINSSGTTATYSGQLTLTASASINANNGSIILNNSGDITGNSFTLTLGGNAPGTNISYLSGNLQNGAGELTKEGSGTWSLNGNNANTGLTSLKGGILLLGTAGALGGTTNGGVNTGGSTISFEGGTLQYSSSNTLDYSSRFSTLSGQQYKIDTNGQTITFASGLNSSTGSLTKTGSGSLYLTANNDYTGSTTNEAGTLEIAGTIASNSIVNHGALTFNPNTDTMYEGTINSLGTFSKTGGFEATLNGNNTFNAGLVLSGGSLKLNGNNTINSGTILAGGTLLLGSEGALGGTNNNGVNTNGGFIRFVGGTLKYSPSNTLDYSSRFDTMASQQFNIDTNGLNIQFASAIGSDTNSSLTKLGSGSLSLTANNTYSGGTTVADGTLVIGNGSTGNGLSGSVIGNIVNHGDLVFERNNDYLVLGNISGTGVLSQLGDGKLTLKGNNTYEGGTDLYFGTLELDSANALGTSGTIIMGGGILQHTVNNVQDYSARFASTGDQQFNINTNGTNITWGSDLISGNGSLTKTGTGTLTLSGQLGYSNATTIGGGILKIKNDTPDLARQFAGTGTLIVESASASFASDVTVGSTSQFANTLSGFGIGGSTNTANININKAININGNTILAGGNINVNQSINASAGFAMLRSSGTITIANGARVTTTDGNIQLVANRFINNNAITTLPPALVAGNGKTWQVFSNNLNPFDATTGDIRGNLSYNFKQYGFTNGSTIAGTGNGFLYSFAPTLTASLVGTVSKVYDGTASAIINQSNHSLSGLVDGDNVQINVTGTAVYASAGTGSTAKDAGTNKLVQIGGLSVAAGNNNGASVYGYTLQNSTASGVVGSIEQAVLSYKADPIKRTVGQANPALTGSVIGFVASETLATATLGTLQFASLANAQSAAGSYAITGQGLSALNYRFEQALTNATALTVEAPAVVPPIYIPPPTPLPLPTTNTTTTNTSTTKTTTVAPAPSSRTTSTTSTTSGSTSTSSSSSGSGSTTTTSSSNTSSGSEATSTASTSNTSSSSTTTESSSSGSSSSSSATPSTTEAKPSSSSGESTTTSDSKPKSEPTAEAKKEEVKKEEANQEKKADTPPEKKPEQKAEAKSDNSNNTGTTAKTSAQVEPAKAENTPKAPADAPAANQTPITNKPPASNTPAPAPVMALAPSPVPTTKPPTPKDAGDSGDKTLAAVAPPEPIKPPSNPKRAVVAVTPVAGSTMVQQQVTAPPRAQLTPGVETRFSGTPNSGNW